VFNSEANYKYKVTLNTSTELDAGLSKRRSV